MRKILLTLLTISLLWACGKKSNVTIEGELKNAKDITIYLKRLHVSNSEFLDSVKLSSSGKFNFKTNIEYPSFFVLRLSNGSVITTIAKPEEKLKITGDAKDFSDSSDSYWVDGSDDALNAKVLNFALNRTIKKIKTIQKKVQKLDKTKNYNTKKEELNIELQKVIQDQRNFSSEFITKNATSLASYMALYQKINKNVYALNENEDIYLVKTVASSLKALYPESEYTKAILANLKQMQKALSAAKLKRVIANSPNMLPEIDLPNNKNKNVKLSSLKGKYILLDFTLLTDKNSVATNALYKKLYKRYKTKGFTIYQVSLDKSLLLWKEVVKNQNINWNCVWDKDNLKSRIAQTWNIKNIPANYIINKNNEIVGKNLFGINLEDRLKEIIK